MRAAVLLYHRIAEPPVDSWRMAVAPARFAEHIEMIASTFRAQRLDDLVRAADEDRIPSSSVAISFDDGYRDNLYAARPMLERHGVPATVFVVTSYVDSGLDFWWDVLERHRAVVGHLDVEYRALHRRLQTLAPAERLTALRELGAPLPSDQTTMGVSELVRLADGEVIDVGAHTVTHPDLRALDRNGQLEEMQASKRQLERWLGRPVTGFAYPYGGVGTESAAAAQAAGFTYACTSAPGALGPGTGAFAVPRLHVESWSADELERRISETLGAG